MPKCFFKAIVFVLDSQSGYAFSNQVIAAALWNFIANSLLGTTFFDLFFVDLHFVVSSSKVVFGKEGGYGYDLGYGSVSDSGCGLWVLLHSLSVRVEDGESHIAFTAVCEFIHSFFICEECRQHFYEMCSSVSTPFNKTRDFVLWLWSAHNKVNERLMTEESSLGTGDPKFPKFIWPSKQLCPSCFLARSRIDWDRDEVFKFLASYYGKMLLSTHKGHELLGDGGTERVVLAEDLAASINAVVVPLGAALAIAIASCAFGALACFWRSRQKYKKLHHMHTLKNI
ncbi:hypothetical protein CsSME_00022521 [Camellia sinensis var. sinensis]